MVHTRPRVAVTVAVIGPPTRRIGARGRRFRCYEMVPGAGFEPAIHGFTDCCLRPLASIAARTRSKVGECLPLSMHLCENVHTRPPGLLSALLSAHRRICRGLDRETGPLTDPAGPVARVMTRLIRRADSPRICGPDVCLGTAGSADGTGRSGRRHTPTSALIVTSALTKRPWTSQLLPLQPPKPNHLQPQHGGAPPGAEHLLGKQTGHRQLISLRFENRGEIGVKSG